MTTTGACEAVNIITMAFMTVRAFLVFRKLAEHTLPSRRSLL